MSVISLDNTQQLNRFRNTPPSASYLAGLIDGDGCIFIRKINDGYQSGITITQCRTNILQIIRYHFGGAITSSAKRNSKINDIIDDNGYIFKYNVRNQFNLTIRSNEYDTILDYIKHSFVVKYNQIKCLTDFSSFKNKQNNVIEKETLYYSCKHFNKCKLVENLMVSNITIEYISGLFDAEGCFYICSTKLNKYYISLTQQNNPQLLVYIQQMLGLGNIDSESKFKIYNKSDCIRFINLIQEQLIIKYNQAKAFMEFLTTDDNDVKECMYTICNKEKHSTEVFDELNQNNKGKERFLETIRMKELKNEICKQIKLQEFYKQKSTQMMGENNHNYGKTVSEETKAKMSMSIRNSKNGVDDNTINKIKQLINEGYRNVDIQIMLNVKRHTVTRIKNGELVCRTDKKKDTKRMTQTEVNISKRKINVDEIIIVIEKLITRWKPKQILDYATQQLNINNMSIDIIKNIKKKLETNKEIIYDIELTSERYNYYLELVEQYNKIKS